MFVALPKQQDLDLPPLLLPHAVNTVTGVVRWSRGVTLLPLFPLVFYIRRIFK